jgi:hypothetical protein
METVKKQLPEWSNSDNNEKLLLTTAKFAPKAQKKLHDYLYHTKLWGHFPFSFPGWRAHVRERGVEA